MAETNYSKYENGPVGAFNKIVEAKEGQVIGAIQKEGMGKIDYVWGKNGKSGYGLAHITEKHTNITGEILAEILSNGEIKYVSFNNTANIEHKDGIAAVRLDWDRREKKWVVTAFIDESRPSTGTADTDKAKGGANETIPGTKPAPNLTQDNGGTGKSQDKSGDRETCYKLAMRSHLFFQIVSPFFQFGVFAGLRYHDFFKTISRFFQMKFHDFFIRIC